MVLCIASLPATVFSLAERIFQQYSNANVKGQKLPRSKKGVTSTSLDLKGSTLKCLCGIDLSMVEKLLQKVAEGALSLHELASQCTSVKQLGKVQAAFIKATNCSNWNEVEQKFQDYVLPEKLEVFKKLNFNKPTIPAEFMKYCQRAMKQLTQPTTSSGESFTFKSDNIFFIEHSGPGAKGIFRNADIFELNGSKLESAFTQVCHCVLVNALVGVRAVTYNLLGAGARSRSSNT